jgi:hypothetical protein
LQALPAGVLAGPYREAQVVENRRRHDVLADGRDRREHDARRRVRKIAEQRHACAALGRRFDRTDGFVARTE